MRNENKTIFIHLVTHFGSQEATATALNVSQPAVSGWVNGTKRMSKIVAVKAEKATNGEFKAIDLCPSLKHLFKQLSA